MPKTIVVTSTAGLAELTPSTALAPDSVLGCRLRDFVDAKTPTPGG